MAVLTEHPLRVGGGALVAAPRAAGKRRHASLDVGDLFAEAVQLVL